LNPCRELTQARLTARSPCVALLRVLAGGADCAGPLV